MSKIREMFEALINDPEMKNNPKFKESEKFGKTLDELTSRIIQPCVDYANNHGDEDESWAHAILIAMACANCKVLYAMQHTAAEEGKDVYEFYHDELLPLCKELVYRESDEMVKKAEQMASEADKEDEGGVSSDRKKEIILAIADPDMSVDDIIDKFFKKDMTDKQRKMVADHIAKVRVEKADKLQRIHEHTNEAGTENHKAI